MHWVDKSDFEVSWFGTLNYIPEESQFVVNKVWLLEQENARAETTIKAEAICDLLADTRNEEGDLRWWGHSHVKMDVFWSSTDLKAMKELSQNGWFLSTVFNQDRKMKTAFTQGAEMPLMIDNIKTHIWDPVLKSEQEEWDSQYKEKVKNIQYVPSVGNYYNYIKGNQFGAGAPPYTADEYKLINLVIAGTISSESFREEWNKTGKPIPEWVKKAVNKEINLVEIGSPTGNNFSNFQFGRNTETTGNSVSDQIIMKQIMEKRSAELNEDDGSYQDDDDDESIDPDLLEYLKLIKSSSRKEKRILPLKKKNKG